MNPNFLTSSYLKFVIVVPFLFFFTGIAYAENVNVLALDFPPFGSENMIPGKGHGTSYDSIKAAFNRVGIETTISFQPLKRAMHSFGTMRREYPIILVGPSALKAFNLPRNDIGMVHIDTFRVSFCYFKSHRSKPIIWNELSDLKPYTIGVMIGSPSTALLRNAGLTLDPTPKADSLIKKVYNKRNDVQLNVVSISHFLAKQLFPNAYRDFTCTSKPLYTFANGLSYWKNDAKTRHSMERFRKGFGEILNNGTYLKILRKYWGEDIPAHLLPEVTKKNFETSH
ncbi:MAG: hypothetical protein GY866_00690 [Proteobacteria bacterium]|nr:hypothetical protein [Pseudomonadota bacterium]